MAYEWKFEVGGWNVGVDDSNWGWSIDEWAADQRRPVLGGQGGRRPVCRLAISVVE
jgi:hypothetical protein